MASHQILKLNEDLSALKDLIELVKNPKLIEAAHEEARRQFTLTEDQEKKYAEAQDVMKKSEALKADIAGREKAISAAKEDHEKDRANFKREKDSVDAAFEDRLKDLRDREDAVAKRELDLIEKQSAHAAVAKKFDEDKKQVERRISDDAQRIANDRIKLNSEREQLNELKAQLDARAKKLKEAVEG